MGVTRQYCGQVGKQENCRVAVSLSISTAEMSLPIAWRLYLPEVWTQDKQRVSAFYSVSSKETALWSRNSASAPSLL